MNQTGKKNYLEEFHAQSRAISAIFDEYNIAELKKRPDCGQLFLLYKKFLDKKKGKAHSRVMFVYLAAKFFGVAIDKDLKNLLPLMAVPELAIWSNYALNWVTDGKNNVSGTKLEENIDLIASQYLLTEVLYFLPDRMLRKFFEWYRWCMRGYLSVEVDLTITNFEKIPNEKSFWIAYSRNHAIPDVGGLFAYCFDVVDDYFELHTPQERMQKIRKIMLEYGRALQVNGDLSDFIIPNEFISTTEKRPSKDYFIDIRTDRLTYPIWLLLERSQIDDPALYAKIKKVAQKRECTKAFYEEVHSYLKRTGIVTEVLTYIRKEKNRLLREIDALGTRNEGTELWKASLLILTDNKFARQLKIDYALSQQN